SIENVVTQGQTPNGATEYAWGLTLRALGREQEAREHFRKVFLQPDVRLSLSPVAAMGLCIFLFCPLQPVLEHFDRFVTSRSPRRLVTRNAVSLLSTMPLIYGSR